MRSSIIIHYHIFKNAGSSVDYALEQSFGDTWTSFEGNHAHDILSGEKLRIFLDGRPELMAVSSHLARPPLPYENSLPIVFLRHPILRAKSVYDFVKKDNTQPNHEVALNGFSEYIRWALYKDTGGGVVIKNYQVIHLSDASFRAKSILDATAQLSDLRQAQSLLFSWPVFGVVECYEKSIALFQKHYGSYIDGLQLSVAWLNKSDHNKYSPDISIEEKLEAVRMDLGDKLFNKLCLANNFDLVLYQSCVKRFEKMLISL